MKRTSLEPRLGATNHCTQVVVRKLKLGEEHFFLSDKTEASKHLCFKAQLAPFVACLECRHSNFHAFFHPRLQNVGSRPTAGHRSENLQPFQFAEMLRLRLCFCSTAGSLGTVAANTSGMCSRETCDPGREMSVLFLIEQAEKSVKRPFIRV